MAAPKEPRVWKLRCSRGHPHEISAPAGAPMPVVTCGECLADFCELIPLTETGEPVKPERKKT